MFAAIYWELRQCGENIIVKVSKMTLNVSTFIISIKEKHHKFKMNLIYWYIDFAFLLYVDM